MPSQVALILYISFIAYLFRADFKYRRGISSALWIPLIWVMIIGSRPVTGWLGQNTGYTSPEEYLEGSPIDRNAYILLIIIGVFILSIRKTKWFQIFKGNIWIFLFLLYCGISIFWSDFPLVSFKRWIKTIGNLVMILIVLTEANPVEAIKTLINRCAYVLIPLSILFIKYFPQLGRGYTPWSYTAVNVGVSGNKNGLGYLCLVAGIFSLWNLFIMIFQKETSVSKEYIFINSMLFLMTMWLLYTAHSATSLAAFMVGASVLTGLYVIKSSGRHIGVYIFTMGYVLLLFYLLFDIYGFVLSALGRDATLTERTYLWEDVLKVKIDPLIGTGYESFWLGNRAVKLWEQLGWQPNQAHNGYLEVYLDLGWVGLALLAGTIISAYRKIIRALVFDPDYGKLRLAFLAAILFYNFTEAAFKGLHLMFFIFIFITLDIPQISGNTASETDRL